MGNASSRAHPGWLVVVLVAALVTAGCVSKRNILPRRATPYEDSDDAVGFVTISTPHFTPMDAAVTDTDDRLDFGSLKDELEIKRALETPTFGSQEITADIFRMAMAARLAGVAIDIEETTGTPQPEPAEEPKEGEEPKGNDADEAAGDSSRKTRKFTTPDDVDPDKLALPGFDFTKEVNSSGANLATILLDMITPKGNAEDRFNLPLDEVATMIASLKTYMVHLEEYYNVEGYNYARGLENSYVPYRMHFTVTAEPGWFSRYRQNDAVCEVTARIRRHARMDDEKELIFLSASPAEVGQTVTEFHAAMAHLALSLKAQAPIGDFARLGANMERIHNAAQRLEGIRAHKTMTVGFPESNKLRIRFIAQRAGNERGRDLQPVSRLITAIVLVPKDGVSLHELQCQHPATRDARGFADRAARVDRQIVLEDTTREMLADIGVRLESSLCNHLDAIDQLRKKHGIGDGHGQGLVDSTTRAIHESAGRFVRQGLAIVASSNDSILLTPKHHLTTHRHLDMSFQAIANTFETLKFDQQWLTRVRTAIRAARKREEAQLLDAPPGEKRRRTAYDVTRGRYLDASSPRPLTPDEWLSYLHLISEYDWRTDEPLVKLRDCHAEASEFLVAASRFGGPLRSNPRLERLISGAAASKTLRIGGHEYMSVVSGEDYHAIREALEKGEDAIKAAMAASKPLPLTDDREEGKTPSVPTQAELDAYKSAAHDVQRCALELALRPYREALLGSTLAAFDTAHGALESLRLLSDGVPDTIEEEFEDSRNSVERFLAGTACDIDVAAYFSPTVYDERGAWNPPRDFLVAVDPIANRLRADTSLCNRMAPIPPWMGPLKERVAIDNAAGHYTLDRTRDTQQRRNRELAGRRLEVAQARLQSARDPSRHPALARYLERRTSYAVAHRALLDEDSVLRARMERRTQQIAVLTTKINETTGTEKAAYEARRKLRIAERSDAADRRHELAEALADASKALGTAEGEAKGDLDRIQSLQEAVDKWIAKFIMAGPADGLAPALGRGEASIRFDYAAPTLLLNERRKLIQHTDVFARVLGLRRSCVGNPRCDACPSGAAGDDACAAASLAVAPVGSRCCAPGQFCQVPTGTGQAVLHVTDIDLSGALQGSPPKNLAQGLKVIAYLQVIVVPHGMGPLEGLADPASQVSSVEIALVPRVRDWEAPHTLTNTQVRTMLEQEVARRSAEAERLKNEKERKEQESERRTSESKRVTADAERDGKEVGRATAEGKRAVEEVARDKNETERVAAEAKRKTDYPPK